MSDHGALIESAPKSPTDSRGQTPTNALRVSRAEQLLSEELTTALVTGINAEIVLTLVVRDGTIQDVKSRTTRIRS